MDVLLQLIRKPDRDWNHKWTTIQPLNSSKLQLIRKPDRDWNFKLGSATGKRPVTGYNSLENPIGIETVWSPSSNAATKSYNSLENPIGIETIHTRGLMQHRPESLQLIRKPDRDWNEGAVYDMWDESKVTTH